MVKSGKNNVRTSPTPPSNAEEKNTVKGINGFSLPVLA